MLGLRFCARAFSSCDERGPLFIAVRGPLTVAASLVAEHKLQTRRLSSCGSRAQLFRGMWDLPRQSSNPCPLHWQADSQPLRHQGSPAVCHFCDDSQPKWIFIFTPNVFIFFLTKFLLVLKSFRTSKTWIIPASIFSILFVTFWQVFWGLMHKILK